MRRVRREESKALRSYWSVHAEAWLRSGVSLQRYCDEHRLYRRTMKRWLGVLETPLPKCRSVAKKRVKVKPRRMPARGSRAYFAFWLMHIEALCKSGLSATEYAAFHRLPVRRFQVLRRRFARNPPPQNWRELGCAVGISARTKAKIRYKLRYERPQTGVEASVATASLAESCTDTRKRRQYTDAQKLAMVAEAAEPSVTVSDVARRHGVTSAMIFRWREQFGFAQPREDRSLLLTARTVERPKRGRPKKTSSTLVLKDLLPMPPGMTAIELPDGRQVYAPVGSDPETVWQYVKDQETVP